mmetsp:Transcript_10907/g.25306  ORF Transcript_10907/g.25306 Transcript_10907/m.25306 type:complete len:246 (+) Transcript_10907:528-1265(+)
MPCVWSGPRVIPFPDPVVENIFRGEVMHHDFGQLPRVSASFGPWHGQIPFVVLWPLVWILVFSDVVVTYVVQNIHPYFQVPRIYRVHLPSPVPVHDWLLPLWHWQNERVSSFLDDFHHWVWHLASCLHLGNWRMIFAWQPALNHNRQWPHRDAGPWPNGDCIFARHGNLFHHPKQAVDVYPLVLATIHHVPSQRSMPNRIDPLLMDHHHTFFCYVDFVAVMDARKRWRMKNLRLFPMRMWWWLYR